MDYRHAFESCRSFNRADGSINRNDLNGLCRKYGLSFDSILESTAQEQSGRVSLQSFQSYMHRHYPYEDYHPASPPPRPSSGSKLQRQSVHTPSLPHHTRTPLKYVGSPQGHGGYERDVDDYKRASYRQEHSRTPEFILSPEETRGVRPPRERPRPQELEHTNTDNRPHRERERERIESPPPTSTTTYPTHRGQRQPGPAKSHRGEDSEDSGNEAHYANHAPSATYSRRTVCKHCRKYQQQAGELQDKLKRLEKDNEGLTKELHAAQNTDLQFSNLLRDNERLRQDLKKLNRGSEHDVDSRYLERQVEDLKKTRDDLEADVMKKREVITDLKGYKREYGSLRQKYETQQRENWKLMDEVQQLRVRVMELERGALIGARRPGDGGADEKAGLSSELSFQRSAMRQTYHFGSGKGEVSRDSRSRKNNRLEMKRTSSAAQVLDSYDEPQKEEYAYPRAKSHRSGTYSDASSVTEGLPLVTTTPDEQSQVFMVMGEDVSKGVLPENLTKEAELALIYSLQNCHSPQEIIKCLVSNGIGTPGEKVQGFRVENEYLRSQLDHLKSRNAMLANSFENAKANMETMYTHAQKVEANNTRLLHALRHCYQACEIYEVLLELRIPDRRTSSSNPSYFPSFDYSSLESSTRSPDREHHSSASSSSGKPPAVLRARNLLHSLDSDAELQNYLPGVRSRPNGTDFRQTFAVWGGSSQNTGTTSGLSSMSGGTEGEITPEELDRLRMYTQALILRKNHFTSTLVSIDGLKGLETVKDWELVKDCLPAGHGGQIMDLEDAANTEELCKVREEKAELRSQIYMMDQEKRRMELEVARMLLHKQKCDKVITELQFQLREERRKRKRDKKGGRRGDGAVPPHDSPHLVQQHSSDLQLERERELNKRYEDLFNFLNHHTRESHSVSEDLMGFVKEMWRQNSSLVDAFEKSKKRQQTEKKRMKQELVSLMNQVHQGSSAPTNEEPSSGAAYP